MISMNERNIYKLVPVYGTYFVLVITMDNAVYKRLCEARNKLKNVGQTRQLSSKDYAWLKNKKWIPPSTTKNITLQ